MTLDGRMKSELCSTLGNYEGRVNHLYLDTKGKVTVGIGHLVINSSAMQPLRLFSVRNGIRHALATSLEKRSEYDRVVRLPWGLRYSAASFKRHTTLIMDDPDIDALADKHIDSFYRELRTLYTVGRGYPANFDSFPHSVKLALFDMIFNVGATKLTNLFPRFNAAIKLEDWQGAAAEANRPDVSPARNAYVKGLLRGADAELAR